MAVMSQKPSSAGQGQKVQVDYARDNSSCNVKNPRGKALGGSTTNVAHSIKGASVPEGTDD